MIKKFKKFNENTDNKNTKLSNFKLSEIEEYLNSIGYSVIKTNELDELENYTYANLFGKRD